MRVASLLPSATEICYALGVEPVGVSHSCDHPPAARGRPRLTRSLVDHETGSAGEIDRQVREIDGTTYALLTDALVDADPDVILTQGTCEVCAVDSGAVHEAVADRGLDCDVVSLDPHTLTDVLDDVRRVGKRVGRAERADELVADLRERVERATVPGWAGPTDAAGDATGVESDGAVGGTGRRSDDTERRSEDTEPRSDTSDRQSDAGDRQRDTDDRPRTLVLDWTDPVMLAGHWIPGMIERAGGSLRRPVADRTAPSTPVEWSWVREYDPETLVVAPCGFETDRAAESLADLRALDGWTELAAVERDAVYVADGSGLFNRPGPRLVDTLEALRAVLDSNRTTDGLRGVRRVSERVTPAD